MTITNEDSDIWKGHLEKEDYDSALDYCEKRNKQFVKKVAKLYANSLLEKKNYHEAALLYVRSDEFFEEVTLKFLISNQNSALTCNNNFIELAYLEGFEEKLSNEDYTQRFILATWQVEMILSEINQYDDVNKIRDVTENLRNLLKSKEKYLDKVIILYK